MRFLIQVRWSNPGSLLLRGTGGIRPDVDGEADAKHSPSVQSTGDGIDLLFLNAESKIRVTVSFKPTIGGNTAEVLSANQTYIVSDSDLVESKATVGEGTAAHEIKKHPLLTLTAQPSQRRVFRAVPGSTATVATLSVFTLRVNTEFVDATELWSKMVGTPTTCMEESGNCWDIVKRFQEPGTELVVLGFTGGTPDVWFVVIPEACHDADTVSTVVFFRPAAYAYKSFDDPQHPAKAMYLLGRFLVTARAEDPGVWWAWDRYHMITDPQWNQFPEGNRPWQFYDWLCAGFPQALHKSGKRAVLVIPLPSGSSYGASQGARLYSLVGSIRALLFARGKIGAGKDSVAEGKLALSGYSYGGNALFPALNANGAHVQEVYVFDCNGTKDHVDDVARWAFQTTDFKLRLTGGLDNRVQENASVKRAVETRLADPSRTASGGVVTQHPASPATFYMPSSAGGSTWWTHVFIKSPATMVAPQLQLTIHGTRHQFVVYGGEDPAFAPGAAPGQPWRGVSFMEDYLTKSSL